LENSKKVITKMEEKIKEEFRITNDLVMGGIRKALKRLVVMDQMSNKCGASESTQRVLTVLTKELKSIESEQSTS